MFVTYSIRWSRKNIFIIISSNFGRVFWKKSAGSFGFKCYGKRSAGAIRLLISTSWEYLLENIGELALFFKFVCMPKHYVQLLRKELIRKIKLSKIKVLGFRFVDRIAFNGCRKRKVRQVV